MLTRTARGALNVTDLATGQENVLSPGIAREALIAEPLSPQDIHTAPQSHSRSPQSIRYEAVMFLMTRLLMSRRYIAKVICLSSSLVLVRRAYASGEIFLETLIFGSVLEPLALSLAL